MPDRDPSPPVAVQRERGRPPVTISTEVLLGSGEGGQPALLTEPDGRARAGIVTLHPAADPGRDYFLFRHLARLLGPRGFAVLSYDRRPTTGDDDVPFDRQADDALAAVTWLSDRIGTGLPVGLWAFSQGAWAASVAAARSDRIAFLVLIGASGVSPSRQMQFSAAEALHRAGFGDEEVHRAVAARQTIEAFLRDDSTHAEAQSAIDAIAAEPWFDLVYLTRELPAHTAWRDMDFDPVPAMRGVRCPVLLVYGDDEAVPADESIAAWRDAVPASGAVLEVVRLPYSGHLPTIGSVPAIDAVDPDYEAAITEWLDRLLASV
jgi:pimeloyl-ACP methyl ester carboxylesterase